MIAMIVIGLYVVGMVLVVVWGAALVLTVLASIVGVSARKFHGKR